MSEGTEARAKAFLQRAPQHSRRTPPTPLAARGVEGVMTTMMMDRHDPTVAQTYSRNGRGMGGGTRPDLFPWIGCRGRAKRGHASH